MSILPSSEKNRKQPPSVYTVILLLSMVFMLIAVIAMWIELRRFGDDLWNTSKANPSVMVMPVENIHLA